VKRWHCGFWSASILSSPVKAAAVLDAVCAEAPLPLQALIAATRRQHATVIFLIREPPV
jgi:hypothetical protein